MSLTVNKTASAVPVSDYAITNIYIELIELQYQKNPSRPISVKLLLDDKEITTLPAIGKDQPRRWGYKSPFGIQASSRITIQLLKSHNVRKWRDLVETAVFTGQEALQQCADPSVSNIERDIPSQGWQLKSWNNSSGFPPYSLVWGRRVPLLEGYCLS
ncbi:hypothetical protein BOTBODRAFT_566395 [Botryobasidium botryosum FD-172 SS1]|uniref:Uncharacterized protein n=1 Tax=Botryobasidium botryosum (strain FD-172 SS1) TaxID=930990 RepID=A0A067LYI7_BOTB1|nr:hypothetical protein BOTBODRAFT_566395 [Botryobasidium botryosum FD-172 SS1]